MQERELVPDFGVALFAATHYLAIAVTVGYNASSWNDGLRSISIEVVQPPAGPKQLALLFPASAY
jgi:hypothetical protein